MSRDIKFRGKRVDNSELVYGHYVKYEHSGVVKCFIVMNWAQIYVNSHEIDSETVGQFTGLKDVENNEIFEGDIVLGYNNPHVVTFADGAFYLTYKNSSVRLSRTCGALKIIGNIYENPELCPI